MKTSLTSKKKKVSLLLLFFVLFSKQTFFSAVGITAPSLSISTCTFPSTYSTLGDIIIDEGATGDFAVGVAQTLILTAPANFEFNPGIGAVSQNGGAVNLSAIAMVVTANTITITYTSGGTNRDDILTISGIQMRGITAASSGNILRTVGNPGSGAITGITNGATSFGSLTSTVACGCLHTIRLTDTFGDGWNGGVVKVQVNGVDVLTNLTFASGFGPVDFTFLASTSDVIRVIETSAGSFPTEMRAQVLDGGGTSIIAVHDPTTGAGTSGTGNCPPPMVITALTVTQASTANASRCDGNQQIVCLQITTTGATSPKTVTQIQTNVSGTAGVGAMSGADIFYTGTSNTFTSSTLFGSNASPSTSTYNINGSQVLTTGVNYFWLVYDLNNSGTLGTTIDGLITQFTASALNYNSGSTPAISTTNPAGDRTLVICYSPGGIGGQSLWLRSDAGTNTSTNNTAVSSWNSQVSSPAITLAQGTASSQPTFKDGSGVGTLNRFNYNPFIYTDGTSNRLFINGDFNLGNTTTGVSAYQVIGQDNGIVSMDWYHTANGNIKLKGDGVQYINRNNGVSEANVKFTPTTIQASVTDIRGACGAISSGRSNAIDVPATGNGWRVASQNGISIGSNLDNGEFMNGGMGEFIIFPSTLNVADNLKVESYLAIKYGVTLGTSASVSNYTSSNSTIVWTGTAAYQNNIIGIGRDDVSTLNQKQSHYYSDEFRMYKGTLSSTNLANASTFALDRSFVLSGDNNGAFCLTAAAVAEMPSGLTNCALVSRLEREWRVTRTNMAENLNVDIKLAACGAPASVNTAHLRLLVDDDGNFANGGTQCYYNGDGTGVVLSYANPYITVSNISTTHIANNVTKFITIASIDAATPLPVEAINYKATLNDEKTVDLTWQTAAERDNDFFTLYKSTDAIQWTYLATVDGAGNSNVLLDYSSEDLYPALGVNYYKLTQTDYNGQINEVGIRSVLLESNTDYSIYPNPAKDEFTILSNSKVNFSTKLYNQLGELVIDKTVSDKISVHDLANGLYYVQIEDLNGLHTIKLVIRQ